MGCRNPKRHRSSIVLVTIVTAILLGQLAGAALQDAARAPDESTSALPAAPTGTEQLSLAEKSLHLAGTPAAASTCDGGAAPGARCATPANSDPTSPYRWNELTALQGNGPGPRVGSAMAWDASDGYVLLFGGSYNEAAKGALADTWTYSHGNWTNITAVTSGAPPPLEQSNMAFDPSSQSLILFGGANGVFTASNYTWSYHNLVWTNLTSTAGVAPPACKFPGLSTDSTDGEVVLWGGLNSSGVSASWGTWTFKGGTWTNVTATAGTVANAQTPSLSDDPAESGVLMVGGASYHLNGSKPYFPVTFVYSKGMWTNLTAILTELPPISSSPYCAIGLLPGPSAVMYYEGLVFLPATGGVVLAASTWEFQNGAWTNITTAVGAIGASDGFVFEPAVATTPADNAMLVYGGITLLGVSISTYALSAPPEITATSSQTVTDVGEPVTFTGTFTEGLLPNVAAWTFGDGTTAAGSTASHTYSTAGEYGAGFTVTDLAGQASGVAIAIAVNPAPTVSVLLAPSPPTAGSSFGLVAVVSGGTGPYTYAWTLGDGTTNSNASLTHTYSNSGSETIGVTVTDAFGLQAKWNVTVEVAVASSAPSISLTSGIGLALLLVVVALVAALAVLAVLYTRKGRGGSRPPPAQYTPATPLGAPAPVAGSSPPWSEGPPPGAYSPPPPPS
jgi:chitodextrinase